jgi:hypothetical protein
MFVNQLTIRIVAGAYLEDSRYSGEHLGAVGTWVVGKHVDLGCNLHLNVSG